MPLFASFVSGSSKALGAVNTSWRSVSVVTGGTLTSDATYYYRTFSASDFLLVHNKILTDAQILFVGGGGGGGGLSSTSSTVPSAGSGGGGSPGLVKVHGDFFPSLNGFSTGYYSMIIGAGGSGGQTTNGVQGSMSYMMYEGSTLQASPYGGSGLLGPSGSASSPSGGVGTNVDGSTFSTGGSGAARSAGGGGGSGGPGFGYYIDAQSGGLGSAGSTTPAFATAYGCGGGGGGFTAGGASNSTGVGGSNSAPSGAAGAGGTGSGGGGAGSTSSSRSSYAGGNGGSGFIVFRYKRSDVGG